MLLADLDILARTVWGESRSEEFLGQVSVAHVVLNRVKSKHRRETTISGAATEPYQFSCWLENDPNREKLFSVNLSDHTFRLAYKAALSAIDGQDPTHGATHYHTISIAKPPWAKNKTPIVTIGNHMFYTGIR